LRATWRRLHLALGLTAGTIFVLAGLTGSVLVFYLEIDALLNPALADARPAAPPRPFEELYQALRRAHPDRPDAWRLEIPAVPGRPITARYYTPAESAQRLFAPLMVSLDPATATVIDTRLWGDYAMTWLYDLHYTLLFERAGRTVLGVLGVLMLLGLGSGVALVWPRRGRWRAALRVRPRPGAARRLFDLHRTAGLYGLLLSVLLVFTGLCLALPEQLRPLLQAMAPLHRPSVPTSLPGGAPRLSLDAAVAIAQRRFPSARLAWIETPQGPTGSYRINLRQPFEPSQRFPRTNVWLDQYSGEVLAVRDPRHDSAPDVFLNWLHPLHNGEAFGLAGRVLACLAGVVPAVLWVTGLLRWRQKRAAARIVGQRRTRAA